MNTRESLQALKTHFPKTGKIEWIGVRPARGVEMISLNHAQLVAGSGIEGDRAGARSGGKRQVTLIQAEYLPTLREWMLKPALDWKDLRRNIVVSGINLNALVNTRLRIGEAILEVSGICHPCRKLEEQLGQGMFNMLRGHGGVTARVVRSGVVCLGDSLHFIQLL